MKKSKTTGYLISIVLILFLASCSNPTKKFEDYVVAGDYANAISTYEAKISGNIEKEQAAQDFMWTSVSNALTDYAKGTIDIETAKNTFNCISKINDGLSVLGADFYYLYDELNTLQVSKESYEEAVGKVDEKDYEAAAELFTQVIEGDIQNYESAKEQLNLCYEGIYQDINSAIDQYMAEEQYELAFETYGQFYQNYAELITLELREKMDRCATEYRNQVVENSIEIYHDSGANAADAAIARGLQFLEDDAGLINVSNLYQSVAEPVSFKHLAGRENNGVGLNGADKTDSMGKDHSSHNMIYFFSISKERESASIERNTHGSYTRLTGSMYFLDTDYDMSAEMKIYADGRVIFESGTLNKKTGGVDFDVDISGVYSVVIEISYIDLGNYFSPCFLDNVYVSRVLSDSEIRQAVSG